MWHRAGAYRLGSFSLTSAGAGKEQGLKAWSQRGCTSQADLTVVTGAASLCSDS